MAISTSKKELLNEIMALDFAINDTILYLDAYPDSKEALQYYNDLVGESNEMKLKYIKNYGPITPYDNLSNTWNWTDGSWPWQYDAN